MPTKTYPNKEKPKDNKQILLDLIAKEYGSHNAMVMDKAFKTQDKQVEEAMTQGGMTANDIGKSIGIDLSSFMNKGKSVASQSSISPQQPPQTDQTGVLKDFIGSIKPATGAYSAAQVTPEGNLQKAGWLRENLGTSTEDFLKQLLTLSQVQKAPIEIQAEQRRQQAESRLQEQLTLNKSAESRRQDKQQLDILRYWGAEVTPEMLEENPALKTAITPMVKKLGIMPNVNPETGELTFDIPTQAEYQQRATLAVGIQKKELESMAEKLPNLDRATDAISQLKSSFNSAWTPKSIDEDDLVEGIFERLRGASAIPVESWTQTNPELHTYLSNVGAFSSLISKGGFMEAGVLTNQDIQRVIQALPKPGYSKERVAMAWKTIDEVMGSARKRFESKKQEYGASGKQTQEQSNVNKETDNKWQKFLKITGRAK